MPKKLAVGAGIAQGANAFMQSFMQAKQLKNQEKLQKNAFIVQALMGQMADENTSNYTRARILESIPQLIGAKREDIEPLYRVLDQVKEENEQIVQDPNSPQTPAIPEQQAQAPTSPEGTQLFAREGVAEGEGGFTGDTKRGNLTPLIIKKKLRIELKKAEDEGDIKKAERIAAMQFDLQEKSYKANGYKVTSEGVNEKGEYVQILTNNSGDTKVNLLPEGFKPLKQIVAEANSNKPSIFIRERKAYHESRGLSEEEAEIKALEDSHNKFVLKQKTGEAYAVRQNQTITGTAPLTESQRINNAEQDRTLRLGIQKDVDDAQAEMNAAKSVMNSLEVSKKAAGDAVTAANQALSTTELSPGEPGYNTLVQQAERARDNYTQIENKYNTALQTEQTAKSKWESAKGRLSGVGTSTNSSTIQAAIKAVRDNPKNKGKVENLSDAEIEAYLRAQGKIQ